MLSGFAGSLLTLWAILGLAALGGLVSERSGIINIALEGKMLMAACFAAIVSSYSHSPALGVGAGVLAAVLMSLAHFALTQTYKVDHIISGMSINLFALGATNFAAQKMPPGTGFPILPITVFVALGILSGGLMQWTLLGTRFGLRLLAVGNDPNKSREMGVEPVQVRLRALLMTGIWTGLAGSLVMTNAGAFTDNMTGGRGYISLAALIVGGWRPIPTLIASFFFALMEASQINFQGKPIYGVELPPALWNSIPFLVTLLALGGLVGKVRPPAGLGKP